MNHLALIPPRLDAIKSHQGIVCVFTFEEKKPLAGITGRIDWRLLGQLSQLTIRGFITGVEGEFVLFPLGNRLPPAHLLLGGLGQRNRFSRQIFENALQEMFKTSEKLLCHDLAVALPGRPENVVDAADAIRWFLDILPEQSNNFSLTIIDTYEVHPIFQAEVERRRMKASVTPPRF